MTDTDGAAKSEEAAPDSSRQFSDTGIPDDLSEWSEGDSSDDSGQLALFGDDDLAEIGDCVEQVKDPGRFPGADLGKAQEKVAGIARALGAGCTYRQIERAFGVSHSTISKVKQLRPELIEQTRKQLSGKFLTLADMAVDQITEKVIAGKVPPNVLAMIAGTAVDKANILDNRPTSITESVKRDSSETDRLRQELRALQKGDPGQIIDIDTD